MLNGIVWKFCTGTAWRDVPQNAAEDLNGPPTTRMLLDVMDVAGVSPHNYPAAEPNLLSGH
ncbi:hypothetical protein [Streptomyces lutosisoli]|uniref:Transposase n=1 Tax=Streptomyces lutosisoli TaxID=2665721 RepID=A0ABW2VRG5_9ACTN